MKNLEIKLLKKCLKRKIKITLATIVAFLLGSSLCLADTLYIRNNNDEIEFKKDNNEWGNNPYKENIFENNIYTNNIGLESNRVGVVNWANNISFTNNGKISITTNESGWGIDNQGQISSLINNGEISLIGNLITDPKKSFKTAIGNYGGNIDLLKNNGTIKIIQNGNGSWGIDNSGNIKSLINNGDITLIGKSVEGTNKSRKTGIGNYGGIIGLLENNGNIKIVENGNDGFGIAINNEGTISDLNNNGIIDLFNGENTYSSSGIVNNSTIKNITNKGIIISKGIATGIGVDTGQIPPIAGIENHGKIENINNTGIIATIKDVDGPSYGIINTNGQISEIINSGKIFSESKSWAKTVELSGSEIINNGFIIAKGKYAYGIREYNNINPIINNGIVLSTKTEPQYSVNNTIEGVSNAINNGLLIGDSNEFIKNNNQNNGIMFDTKENGKYTIYGINNTTKDGAKISDKTIVNATLINEEKSDKLWTATGSESIALNGENKSDMIYNGITDTLKISGENTLDSSIVNGYTSAIIYDENGGTLALDNSTINGGGKENTYAIQGKIGEDNLILKNNTIINGDINLGSGNDNLTVSNDIQLNGNILGGDGKDNLVIGNSKNNFYHSIDGFEDITLKENTSLTFFETAKVTGTENLKIEAGSQLNLRVDSNSVERDGSYSTHALYNTEDKTLNIIGDMSKQDENDIIHESTNQDKFNKLSILNIVTNGINHLTTRDGAKINFGNTRFDAEKSQSTSQDYINKGGVWVKTDSILTHAEIIEEKLDNGKLNTKVVIKGQEDLFGIVETFPLNPIDPAKPIIRPTPITPAKPIKSNLYIKLNDIYRGIYTSGDKNFGALNDIVVNYSFTDKDKGDYTLIENDKMQMATLLGYLKEVYSETPYSFSNEATRKSMELFHDAVRDNNFKAKEKEWLIYGGFTHENGDQEQSYYGKNYHGFDVGTSETNVDIKLTGAYGQFEYGNSETLSIGIILGGNKSKIDVSSSKIDGSSAYLGAYIKKDIKDFRITSGLGYQYTEYDGKRNTINQNYSEDYSDKSLNLYLDGKYMYEIGDQLYLEPKLGLSYTYIAQDRIKENQNSSLALDIDSKRFNILEGTVGVDIKKVILTEKANHSLTAGVTYKNILNGDEADSLTANYGGNDFDILIPHKNKDNISLGIKYEVEVENGIFFNIKGNYFLNADSKENSNKNIDKNEWRIGSGIGYKL